MVKLVIDGELILTTPEHPFFISGDSWVAAGELWLGARVRKADGSYGAVEILEVVERPQQMYNLTVDEAHTYFVGDEQWLVHNSCLVYTSTKNTGQNLERFAEMGGWRFQFKTGHGYNRPHKGSSGVMTDIRTTSLTPDQIENAIALDIEAHLASGGILPIPGRGFTGPLNRTVNVGGIDIGNRVIQRPDGVISIGTYYLK